MYGIAGAAPDTEERIRAIKGRGETKPFLQLIAHASWVARAVRLRAAAEACTILAGAADNHLSGAGWRDSGASAAGFPLSAATNGSRWAAALLHQREPGGKEPMFDIEHIKEEFERDVRSHLRRGESSSRTPVHSASMSRRVPTASFGPARCGYRPKNWAESG